MKSDRPNYQFTEKPKTGKHTRWHDEDTVSKIHRYKTYGQMTIFFDLFKFQGGEKRGGRNSLD